MKQFEYVGASGPHMYPYDIAAAIRYSDGEIHKCLYELEVGGRVDTMHGYWERLPDAPGGEQRDERLERIATAMMAAIVGKFPPGSALDDDARELDEQHARGAVIYAKALIAELDKQS